MNSLGKNLRKTLARPGGYKTRIKAAIKRGWRPSNMPGSWGSVAAITLFAILGLMAFITTLVLSPPQLHSQDSQTAGENPPAKSTKPFKLIETLNIDELKRIVQTARDAGMAKEQIQNITVEDVDGNTYNALEYIQAYDAYMNARRLDTLAQKTKPYLTPMDVLNDLNAKHPAELEDMRETHLWAD